MSDSSEYNEDIENNVVTYDSEEDDDVMDSHPIAGLLGATAGVLVAGMMISAKEDSIRQERLIAERKEGQERRRQWRQQHKKGLTATILLCVFLIIFLLVYYEISIRIPVGYNSSDLIDKNYQEVVRGLERSGFKYISSEAIEDLTIKNIEDDNLVFEIKIGKSTTFNEDSKYPANFPVKVKYHTLEMLDTPISSKAVKKIDYDTALKLFEDAGFTKIVTKVEYDIVTGWFAEEGKIKSVVINEDKRFYEGNSYRADAEVIITYHALKKNKP